jgi:hypothetical protein
MIGGIVVDMGVTTGVLNRVGTGGGVREGDIVGSMSSELIVGVGKIDTRVVGVDCGESNASICDALLDGLSGLQPTVKNNAKNSNATTNAICFEETAMFNLLMTAWTTATKTLGRRSHRSLLYAPPLPHLSIGDRKEKPFQ